MTDPLAPPRPTGLAGDDRLEREATIAAPPDLVYAFWTDAERLARWMGRRAEVDARVGGAIRIDYGHGNVASGRFTELEPGRRIAFTFGWEAPGELVPPGASLVTVDLEPVGDGTRLRLVHTGLPTREVEGHGVGWDQFLPRLGEVAAAG